MKSPALIILSLLLLVSPSFAAQISLVSEDRRASASAFVSSADDFDQQQFSEVAPEGAPFEVSLFATAELPTGEGDGHATQISYLNTASLHAEGTVSAVASSTGETTTTYVSSQSNVAIRFTVTTAGQTAPFVLSGFIEGEDNATVTVQLSRPFETVAWFSATGQHVDIHLPGILEPDTYDLNVTCGANGASFGVGSETGQASYSIDFALNAATDAPVIASERVAAYPNPFRASTRLTVPDGVRAVRILDAGGRVVRTMTTSGEALFDGRDAAGRPLAAGVYWAQPIGADRDDAVKLVRLR